MRVLTPLRGLGAVATPSPSYLKAGYVWAPWMTRIGSTVQRSSCGTPAERKLWPDANKMYWVGDRPACWEGGGGAWGQQPAIGDHGDDVNALISRSTTVTTVAKPPVQSPGEACASAWNTWRGANPAAARCAGDTAGRQQFVAICTRIQMGTLAPSPGMKQWTDYVARRCSAPPPQSPPPTSRPPTTMPPPGDRNFPPMDSPPLDGPNPPRDGRDPGSGFDPGVDDVPETGARAFLRQVGPVVGIGLLAAIVLTVARKKKLFKRRR